MNQIRTDDLELDDPELQQRLELMRGPVGAWPVDRDVQVRALEKLGLRSDHHFLEIGCGPLQSGIPLIRFLQPGHYTGVFPIDDNAVWEKNAASLKQLHKLRERLKALEKGGT